MDNLMPPETSDIPAAAAPVALTEEPGANLVPLLPETYLKHVGSLVLTDAEADYRSMAKWRERVAEFVRLYEGDVPDAGSEQSIIVPMHVPYVRRAVKMFKAKMFSALYPQDGELLALRVRSPELQNVAALCALHMNDQLRSEIIEYVPNHDRIMTQILVRATAYEVFYWDASRRRPCHQICLTENVWINFQAEIASPEMDGVRVTWRKRAYQWELEDWETDGYYVGVTKAVGGQGPLYAEDSYDEAGAPKQVEAAATPMGDLDEKPVDAEARERSGIEPTQDATDGRREILEQDRMLKLPGQARARAVTVCVDRETGAVLRLSWRERQDPADYRRFLYQQEQNKLAHETALQQHAEEVANLQAQQAQMSPELGLPLPTLPPEPLPPPEPPPARTIPWNRWTKHDCEVNPEGALGEGIGHDVGGHNILANKIATRVTSLMTAQMLPTAIASRQSRFLRGRTQLNLGAVNVSEMTAEQLHRTNAGFMFLQFPPPDPQAHKILELADRNAQEVTAFDIAAGGPGMSGETATEAEMRQSNATANISLVATRYNRARACALKNLAYINSLTLPEEGVVVYVPQEGGAEPMRIYREDYARILNELEVAFLSDPSMESKTLRERRTMKAFQTLLQVTTAVVGDVPILDPLTAVKMIRAVAIKVIEALDMPREWSDWIQQSPEPQIPGINAPAVPEGEANGQSPAEEETGATGATGAGGMVGRGSPGGNGEPEGSEAPSEFA